MQIIPADLPAEGERFHGALPVEFEPVEGEATVHATGPVAFDVRAQRTGVFVSLGGTLSAAVEVTCDRCLGTFPVTTDLEFEVHYCPAEYGAPIGESELDEKDLDLDYYGEEGIDLQQLLGEQILLSLPMKPLCRQDCRGLCPQCGINLNEQTCSCAPDVDPRLASLAAIRDQL